ncbi:MAG: flagellar biosynthetic protein FliQ [Phycisphaerales bacterium]|nr:flagellar biosynthetic protein FliQ [bacterium]
MIIDDSVVDLVQNAIMVALKVSAPILVAGVLIGLTISIFQSVTQIQEQTLSLVPKIFVMCIVAVILMPWIVMRLAEFCVDMFRLF